LSAVCHRAVGLLALIDKPTNLSNLTNLTNEKSDKLVQKAYGPMAHHRQ